MKKKPNISSYLDSTYLKTASEAGITETENREIVLKVVSDAISSQFACVMIRPHLVSTAIDYIRKANSNLNVGTVVDFPLGDRSTEYKLAEAKEAIKNGAFDIDFVCDYNAFKRRNFIKFDNDIIEGTQVCVENNRIVKWIIETGALSKGEIRNISKRIADLIQSKFSLYSKDIFIKTSTGYYGGFGATINDIKLIKSIAGNLKIKASGGVSNYKQAIEMISVGADRIGTSKAQFIYDEYKKQ